MSRGGVGRSVVGMRVFVTHNAEDLAAYYSRALGELRTIATVTTNPHRRDLTTDELIEAASGCDVIVAHRSTPGDTSLFEGLPELVAFLRTAVDISTVDVDAASPPASSSGEPTRASWHRPPNSPSR